MRFICYTTALLVVAMDSIKAIELLSQAGSDIVAAPSMIENEEDVILAQNGVQSWLSNRAQGKLQGRASAPALALLKSSEEKGKTAAASAKDKTKAKKSDAETEATPSKKKATPPAQEQSEGDESSDSGDDDTTDDVDTAEVAEKLTEGINSGVDEFKKPKSNSKTMDKPAS